MALVNVGTNMRASEKKQFSTFLPLVKPGFGEKYRFTVVFSGSFQLLDYIIASLSMNHGHLNKSNPVIFISIMKQSIRAVIRRLQDYLLCGSSDGSC